MPNGIPSGWTYSNQILNNNAVVVVPGSPGITHVLDYLNVHLVENGAAGALSGTFTISDGATVIFTWNFSIPSTVAGQTAGDDFNEAITKMSTPGNALTIRVNFATSISEIIATGHDL